MKNYPFVNPIIVNSENVIIDGQHRNEVCKQFGVEPNFIKINFTSEELKSEAAQKEIQSIKSVQKKKLENIFKENKTDFRDQISLCSSDDKFYYFLMYKEKFTSDKLFWKTLGDVYVLSSNNYKYRNEINKFFKSERKYREFVMTEEENKIFHKLNDKVKIYRGMSEVESSSECYGISWTLKFEIANMFATTYIHNYDTASQNHIVKELLVDKKNIIAYFNRRSEDEIIYMP